MMLHTKLQQQCADTNNQ